MNKKNIGRDLQFKVREYIKYYTEKLSDRD